MLVLACLILQAAPVMASGSTDVTGTIPLVAYDVVASSITTYSATISWKTNGNATSQVFYDTVAHANIYDYRANITENSLVPTHSIALSGLSSSTTYHYRVRSVITGTEFIAISGDYTFTTLSPPSAGGGEDGGPTTSSVTTNVFGSTTAMTVNSNGVVQNTVTFTSADGKESLTVPAGTIAKDGNGNPLSNMTAVLNPNPPAP